LAFLINNNGTTVNSLPVPFWIMWDGGIQEANPETGPEATVRFKCHWDDRYALTNGLLGLWVGSPPGNVSYTGPFNYPPSPNLLCTAVSSIVPLGKAYFSFLNSLGLPTTGWLARQYAVVTAHFTRPPWVALDSGGYFSINFDGAGEFLQLAGTTYRFGDGTPDNVAVGIFVPEAQITVRRFRMPFLPDQYMVQLAGTVNIAPFAIGNNIYNTGTLLFMPGHTATEGSPAGQITYQADYVFMYRSIPWNYDFHPNRTTGWALVTDGNGNPKYQFADFNILP
jgi:hypothetical protein